MINKVEENSNVVVQVIVKNKSDKLFKNVTLFYANSILYCPKICNCNKMCNCEIPYFKDGSLQSKSIEISTYKNERNYLEFLYLTMFANKVIGFVRLELITGDINQLKNKVTFYTKSQSSKDVIKYRNIETLIGENIVIIRVGVHLNSLTKFVIEKIYPQTELKITFLQNL